jgi:serine/threonine-protein kinase HipA
MNDDRIEVVVAVGDENVLAGRFYSHRRRGVESATFSYSMEYLQRTDGFGLDPGLPLSSAPIQTDAGLGIFRAFSDAAPDRWGQNLIRRAEKQRATAENRAQRSFGDVDYLLDVRDDLRQGALRFRDPHTGHYLANDTSGVPQLTDVPTLLAAAAHAEQDTADLGELTMLLRAGSSLGGARPKSHVRTAGGRIGIAKFPSAQQDTWNVMAWEKVTLDLAAFAGIRVPSSQLLRISGRSVLVLDRFDRRGEQRIGYVSAMTMLEARDGDIGSYVDIAAVIETNSPTVTRDLRELWRRIAFGILVSNTDDHLRNHGFLRTGSGWALSPAFDINPNPDPGPKSLSTAIVDDDVEARVDTLMNAAAFFRLKEAEARAVLAEVVAATSRWRQVAHRNGLDDSEINTMTTAFEHPQADAARTFT